MSDKKATSIRADPETFERFRQISLDFSDQGAALNAMIKAWETSQAKTQYPQFTEDIESIEHLLSSIREMFNHRLQSEINIRGKIREEFVAIEEQLRSDNNRLREEVEKLRADAQEANENAENAITLLATAERSTELALTAKESAEANVKSLKATENERQSYIATLLKQLDASQTRAERCMAAEAEAADLRDQLRKAQADSRVAIAEAEAKNAAEVNNLLRQINDLERKLHVAESRAVAAETDLDVLKRSLTAEEASST